MKKHKVRWIGRWDETQRLYRAFSVLWGTKERDPGYLNRLSVSLKPVLFRYVGQVDGWFLIVCGIRLHMKSSPNGVLT